MKPDALYKVIIAEALSIVDDQSRWTTGTQARDQEGRPCAAWNGEAVTWCFYGAMIVAALRLCLDLRQSLLIAHNIRERMTAIGSMDPIAANDFHGREATIALARQVAATF